MRRLGGRLGVEKGGGGGVERERECERGRWTERRRGIVRGRGTDIGEKSVGMGEGEE